MNMNSLCPCGSTLNYGSCCQTFHAGKASPETAEKLMRSRYAAYVVGAIDYIDATNDPESKDAFDREAAREWSSKSEWLGLEIIATRNGKQGDREGEVEFKAKYRFDGNEQIHHEVSLFRIGTKGHWIYCEGKTIQEPIQRSEPKVGRNDPCSCGSGKKYKKCCAT